MCERALYGPSSILACIPPNIIECAGSRMYLPASTLCRASSYSNSMIRGSLCKLEVENGDLLVLTFGNRCETKSYLIFSSSRFAMNTLRRSWIIGSSYLFCNSFALLYFGSNFVDQSHRMANGRLCGFNWISSNELAIHTANTLCASNLLPMPSSSQPNAAARTTCDGHWLVPSISIWTAMLDIK